MKNEGTIATNQLPLHGVTPLSEIEPLLRQVLEHQTEMDVKLADLLKAKGRPAPEYLNLNDAEAYSGRWPQAIAKGHQGR